MATALIDRTWGEHFSIDVYTPSGSSAHRFAKLCGIDAVDRLDNRVKYDALFLAFKPQQLLGVAEELESFDLSNTLVVSILASISVEKLKELFKTEAILRLMPNTPAKIGQGVITYFSSIQNNLVDICLELLGRKSLLIDCQDEQQIDLSTPITGSGPAFIFELARIWQLFLEEQGFSASMSRQMVAKTIAGSALLLESSEEEFITLRNQVTSKKGVTEQGLISLANSNFEDIVLESLERCLQRIEELKVN